MAAASQAIRDAVAAGNIDAVAKARAQYEAAVDDTWYAMGYDAGRERGRDEGVNIERRENLKIWQAERAKPSLLKTIQRTIRHVLKGP